MFSLPHPRTRTTLLSVVAGAAVLLATGCASDRLATEPPDPTATPASRTATGPTGAPDATAPSHGSTPATTRPAPVADPPTVPPVALLRAMRTGHHAGYDRVVLEFTGPRVPRHTLAYVDRVTADPSDRPVALRGRAFLLVVLQDATLDTAPRASDPATAPRYTGPRRLTPDHPLLREVALVGDFESVLSLGIGLDRPAGVHVRTLTGPARLVVDVWSTPPRGLLWPVRTAAEAAALQREVDAGHQPWRCDPASTARVYALDVLGWSAPEPRRIADEVYQVTDRVTGATAVVSLTRPFPTRACPLQVVTDAAR